MAPSDADADADTFHAFPSLPAELRCIIWRLAAFPRIVTLHQRPPRLGSKRNPKYLVDQYLFHCDSVPAVLHACRESRREAPYVRTLRDRKSPRYIWLNYELDTVRFVDNAIFLDRLSDQECAAMKRIILHFSEIDPNYFAVGVNDLDRFCNLESVQVHTAYGFAPWSHTVGFLERAFQHWFGGCNDGWVCPEISLIDLETGFELISPGPEFRRAPKSGSDFIVRSVRELGSNMRLAKNTLPQTTLFNNHDLFENSETSLPHRRVSRLPV
ncbi:uncharacterized protein B0I36DRAFT_427683 [Microdochium trichocladiopsis]|uniref:2EXR domain-containing protein n=1 Tax=Microdochium trichocladiopsis TaxID=1682393 RepID=A0A9P9BWJ6_9PEZI|nr:uncharacterized protein B0I36DRAFT_427683 [Microdochium trichocladiopsis]KAH7041488.1 hypothetical protein B0I36DRAFT_427683 [Microdochium trichocladiopsis]